MFASSIAIVIGPTPPGTGVIAPATSLTASNSTSPTSPSSVRLVPTSITVAPGLTISAPTSRGEPTAATRMSAREQTAGRSRVREWQTVTVAFSPEEQRRERPADQDRAAEHHGLSALDGRPGLTQQLDDPARRARDEPRPPLGEQARAGGAEPVDVLRRVDRRDHRVLVDLLGERQLHEDAVDGVGFIELGDELEQLVLRRGGAEAVVERAHADLLRLLALVADVDVRGGIVAHQHRREARHVATASGGELPHPLGDPLAHLGGDRLAVDRLCAHATFLSGA